MWLCINSKKNLWREAMKKNSILFGFKIGDLSRPYRWKVSKGTLNSRITDLAWTGILHLFAWQHNLHRSKSKILVFS